MAQPIFKSVRYTSRWLCYLDLLGFSALVESQSINRVIRTYGEVLRKMEQTAGPNKAGGIYYSWFSDTFILYTRGSKREDYARLENASRVFFETLTLKRIPVRGAITFGKLYTHLERNIFVGPALIDAYKYGEKQNWLGLLLTPSAVGRLTDVGLDPHESPYYVPVPSQGVLKRLGAKNVYAYAFNRSRKDTPNPILQSVRDMRDSVELKYRQEYEATIAFAEANQLQ